jgi:hypothetical protein
MSKARVLIVFPASLYGRAWAGRPRVKPELVSLLTHLRHHEVDANVLDLEVEIGNPGPGDEQEFLRRAEELLAAADAEVFAFDCWTSLQYSATIALAEIVRRRRPQAVIAVAGYHPTSRPADFTFSGSPVNWLLEGEAENALHQVALAVAGGDTDVSGCREIEGAPLEHTLADAPDYQAYPYTGEGLDELGVYLSRGCPYHVTACMLRPGGSGWHAYPPAAALTMLDQLAALKPGVIDVLDPTFGYDNGWRIAMLEKLAETYRRAVPLAITARPDALTRADLDKIYSANIRLRFDVETLSPTLLLRREITASPARYVEHTLDLLGYANAKGVRTSVGLVFNQPGETAETAAETIAALREFAQAAPNTSVSLRAESWAYFPFGEPAADIDAPASRFGTVIMHPQWWKQPVPSEAAAKSVLASTELGGHQPGDESYWHPQFTEVAQLLESKLTAEARRGQRSHESVGSAATGVPNGWWIEGRWH